jgi:WD40 repeat protein
LTPCEPSDAIVDILHSLVADDPEWGSQAAALEDTYDRPRLVNRWRPSDLPISARRVLTGDFKWVAAATAAPDGSWLATGGHSGVQIWDPVTGQERITFAVKGGGRNLAVAPDGSWLATGGFGGIVRIWDPVTGQERASFKVRPTWVNGLAAAPDGSWLVSTYGTGTMRIWDVATGRVRTNLSRLRSARAVAIAPDGSWLAYSKANGKIRIWDTNRRRTRVTLRGHGDYVGALAVAPDGSWLVSGGTDKTVRIWDASTGQLRTILTGHTAEVNAVAVAPDGSWLASGADDKTVRIWDVPTGQLRTILTGHTAEVNAVAAAPDGSWLVSGGADKTVRIWDVTTGRLRATFKSFFHHSLGVRAVAVAPDGSWLVSGDSQEVWIRNAVSGNTRAGLSSLTLKGGGVAIAPDGSWLVTGGRSFVCIWDVTIRKPMGSRLRDIAKYGAPLIETPRAILKGHVGVATTVAVSPDGRWLASGGEDGTLLIWNVATRQAVTLMRVDNAILECAWLGNKGLVIVGPAGVWTFNFLANDAAVPTGDHER